MGARSFLTYEGDYRKRTNEHVKEERDQFLLWNSNTEDLLLLPELEQTTSTESKVKLR